MNFEKWRVVLRRAALAGPEHCPKILIAGIDGKHKHETTDEGRLFCLLCVCVCNSLIVCFLDYDFESQECDLRVDKNLHNEFVPRPQCTTRGACARALVCIRVYAFSRMA